MSRDYLATAKVTLRMQIRIPSKIQKKLDGLKEGDYILFNEEDGRIYIEKGVIKPAKK